MDTFQALAEPRRRQIIELLAKEGKLSATDISDNFSITPSAISQHLKILREAKLVDMEKRAQSRIYSLNPTQILKIEKWAQDMKEMWNKKFDKLDKILKEVKSNG